MPYRRAHWFIAALFPLIALAFYPQYFRTFSTSSAAFHLHGLSAMTWLAALALQSWAIHGGHRELHRAAGKAALIIFPLFFASFFLIMHSMAAKYVAGDLFYARFGPRLGVLDLIGGVGVGVFVYLGVRNRRRVHDHSAWLLGTLIFLLSPIFGRLMAFTPWLPIRGPEDFGNFPAGVQFGNLVALLAALAFGAAARRARPAWWTAAGLTALAAVLFETVGLMSSWERLFASVAQVPAPLLFGTGLLAGTALVWVAWTGARRSGKATLQHA